MDVALAGCVRCEYHDPRTDPLTQVHGSADPTLRFYGIFVFNPVGFGFGIAPAEIEFAEFYP